MSEDDKKRIDRELEHKGYVPDREGEVRGGYIPERGDAGTPPTGGSGGTNDKHEADYD